MSISHIKQNSTPTEFGTGIFGSFKFQEKTFPSNEQNASPTKQKLSIQRQSLQGRITKAKHNLQIRKDNLYRCAVNIKASSKFQSLKSKLTPEQIPHFVFETKKLSRVFFDHALKMRNDAQKELDNLLREDLELATSEANSQPTSSSSVTGLSLPLSPTPLR